MAEVQRGEATAQSTLPGLTLRTGVQLVLSKANTRDAYTAVDQSHFGHAQPHSLLLLS